MFSDVPTSMTVAARARGRLAAGLAATLLAACAAPPPPPPTPELSAPAPAPAAPVSPVTAAPVALPEPTVVTPMRPRNSPTDQMLAWADRVRGLSPTELALEITRLGDPVEAVPQVQLALALLQTHLPADTARALGLLQRAQASTQDEARALQPLVRLLAARTLEQRKLEDAVDRQNQQARDSQRRIDQLTERLEAVRAIERSLTAPRGASGASTAAPNGRGHVGP